MKTISFCCERLLIAVWKHKLATTNGGGLIPDATVTRSGLIVTAFQKQQKIKNKSRLLNKHPNLSLHSYECSMPILKFVL